MNTATPLSLLLEPGDYQCRTSLPDASGHLVRVAGQLTLAASRPPVLTLWDDIPLESDNFPQHSQLPALEVDLVTGQQVTLVDCHITVWFLQQGWVDAGAALVRQPEWPVSGPLLPPLDPPDFVGATVQVTGLDAVLGVAPLAATRIPLAGSQPATWSATENHAAHDMVSADAAAEVRASWEGRYSGTNRYQHRVVFSPTVALTLTDAVSLRELVERWVLPLQRIVGLATGRRESVSYLDVTAEARRSASSQVFYAGSSQDPYISDEADLRKTQPAFQAYGPGNPTLLDLCRAWQRAEDAHNPLVETFGAFLLEPPQHPRARFLLLVQALEGLYNHLHADQRAERAEAWQEKVRATLEACAGVDAKTRTFIKKNLRPASNLAPALRAVLDDLPSEQVVEQVAALGLVRAAIADPAIPHAHDWPTAIRTVRNDLSHGTRGWETRLLRQAAELLERCCRAHLMLLLGIDRRRVTAYLDVA